VESAFGLAQSNILIDSKHYLRMLVLRFLVVNRWGWKTCTLAFGVAWNHFWHHAQSLGFDVQTIAVLVSQKVRQTTVIWDIPR
jgi:hypothetical protein